ncbi:hypothetical protein BH11PAT4_BH11PAT4_1320 [soil metagenome]
MGALLTSLTPWVTTPLALFAGAVLLYLSWCSFTHWFTSRKLFHFLLSVLLLTAAPLLSLSIYLSSWGALLGIAVAGFAIFAVRDLLAARTSYHITFLRGLTIATCVWVALSCLFTVQHYRNYQQRTDQRLRNAIEVVSAREQKVRELGSTLSQEGYVAQLVQGGSQTASLTELQRFLVANQLQFVTVTTTRGTILVRAHDQNRSGDNILDFSPWVLPALTGEVVSGKAYDERGLPTIAAAVPVRKDTVPIGMVVVGFNLNQNFASDIRNMGPGGIAVGTVRGIRSHSTGSSIESAIYSSAALDEIVRKELGSVVQGKAKTSFTSRLLLDEEPHIIQASILSTLVSSQPIALITIEVDHQLPVNPYALAMVIVLLGLILFNLKMLITLASLIPTISTKSRRSRG